MRVKRNKKRLSVLDKIAEMKQKAMVSIPPSCKRPGKASNPGKIFSAKRQNPKGGKMLLLFMDIRKEDDDCGLRTVDPT